MEKQLVVFILDKEEYGIDISRVREIVRIQEMTKIPGSARFMEGIVNLRGQIVPVIDLKKRFFDKAKTEKCDESSRRMIVVTLDDKNIGMLVDGVSEIIRVSEEFVEDTPEIVSRGSAAGFVSGVAKVGNRLVVLLDLDLVFAADEKEKMAEAAEESAEANGEDRKKKGKTKT